MPLRDSPDRYGWLSMLLHWGTAVAVFGLFGLGLWMRELSYYDPWYQQGPFIHKSLGILVFAAVLLRLLWRALNPRPLDAPTLRPWERITAHITHYALYAMLLATMLAGYLISTADGRAIDVFTWFSVPATLHGLDGQEDIAGDVHEVLAWLLVISALVHAAAALKHHFFDRDNTLLKMLGVARSASPKTPTQHKERGTPQ